MSHPTCGELRRRWTDPLEDNPQGCRCKSESHRRRSQIHHLCVRAVGDRVATDVGGGHRVILDAVNPLVDPHLGCAAFAYRPGLGVIDAVEAVVGLREAGLRWVLRTDIDDCFPTIPVDLARRRLAALVDDEDILAVVDLLLPDPRSARAGAGGPFAGWPRGARSRHCSATSSSSTSTHACSTPGIRWCATRTTCAWEQPVGTRRGRQPGARRRQWRSWVWRWALTRRR